MFFYNITKITKNIIKNFINQKLCNKPLSQISNDIEKPFYTTTFHVLHDVEKLSTFCYL